MERREHAKWHSGHGVRKIARGIKLAIFGNETAGNPVVQYSGPQFVRDLEFVSQLSKRLGLEGDVVSGTIDDARELFEADKQRVMDIMADIRDMETIRLNDNVPDGYLESTGVGIYPFGEGYVTLIALKSLGFDIQLVGPVLSGTKKYDHDLHDEVCTAVRADEYERIELIRFFAIGHTDCRLQVPSNPKADGTASGLLGAPVVGSGEYTPNMWHSILDTALRTNVYFQNGDIFRSEHFARKQSGFDEWYDELLENGLLARTYMTAHLMHDVVYRHRDAVEKTDGLDLLLYKLFKDNGFEPFGPEELVGMARTMIAEVLDQRPEWEPDAPKTRRIA